MKRKRILITSSKGGIGKSTTALMLAYSMAACGKSVLLCDCDAGGRSLDLMLGIENDITFDLYDVILRKTDAAQALHTVKLNGVEFSFCAAPAFLSIDNLQINNIGQAFKALEEASGAEVIICDSSGSIVADILAKEYSDHALIISTQQPASIRSAESTAIRMEMAGILDISLIINLFDYKSAAKGKRCGILDIIDGSGVKVIGVVPQDKTLMILQEKSKIPSEKSASFIAYSNIAKRLGGQQIRLFEGIKKLSGQAVI